MKDPVEALELQLDNAEEELVYLRNVNAKYVKSIISLRLRITELEDERNSEESLGDKYHIPPVTCGPSTG
jgi:hypothetical protein